MLKDFLQASNITVVDDHTVKFKLDRPFAAFTSFLPWWYIMNPAQVMANEVDGDIGQKWLTENEAVFLLKNTVQDMWNELEQSLPWIKEKPIIVQEQILNMVYNLGLPNLLKFQNMLAALESNDGTTAADEALNSKWARQVGQRAQRIADIFRAEL